VTTYREHAAALLEKATNGEQGIVAGDPLYQEITGGRDQGPHYSSCVDLPFWLLRNFRPEAAWAQEGPEGNALVNFWRAPWRAPKPGEVPKLGDTWLIWRGNKERTHAKVIESLNPETGELVSWDYGQGWIDPDKWFPGDIEGIKKHQKVELLDTGRWIFPLNAAGEPDGRELQLVLTLDDALGFDADQQMAEEPGDEGVSFWGWLLGGGVLGGLGLAVYKVRKR